MDASASSPHSDEPLSSVLHLSNRRTSVSVPLLDEESLKVNTGGSSTATSGGFTLVSQMEEPYRRPRSPNGGLDGITQSSTNSATKNSDHAQIYAMLQQQQAVAMAAAQLETAFNQTCYMLQQCSHNALLTVLMSLLNDFPTTLLQPIRVRVEQVLAQQMSPNAAAGRAANSGRKPGSNFVPNSSAAPWTPSNLHGSTAVTPIANSNTSNHRRGRGHKGKEEEQEMCSIHNNMRAMKHLTLNASTGLYECIHGFHCLVDGPAGRSPRRAAITPTVATANTATVSNSNNNGVGGSGLRGVACGPLAPSPASQPFVPAPGFTRGQEHRFSPMEMEALRMMSQNMSAPSHNGSNGGNPHLPPTSQLSDGNNRSGLCMPSLQDPDSAATSDRTASVHNLGGGFTVVGGDRTGSSTGTSPLDARLNMDLPSLEYLLQSVRDIDDE